MGIDKVNILLGDINASAGMDIWNKLTILVKFLSFNQRSNYEEEGFEGDFF